MFHELIAFNMVSLGTKVQDVNVDPGQESQPAKRSPALGQQQLEEKGDLSKLCSLIECNLRTNYTRITYCEINHTKMKQNYAWLILPELRNNHAKCQYYSTVYSENEWSMKA